MRSRNTATLILLGALCLPCIAYTQEYAVVVHPKNDAALTKADVANIFLGKKKVFSTGKQAIPVIQQSSNAVTKAFVHTIVHKSLAQFRSYWSRRIFSGKGYPPKKIASDQEVKAFIDKNENAIGIISSDAVDDTVRVILRF